MLLWGIRNYVMGMKIAAVADTVVSGSSETVKLSFSRPFSFTIDTVEIHGIYSFPFLK